MKFQYPAFLWALFVLLVPVIIHLLNLRRHQVVYFSNVGFLKKVKRASQRKSKLKQLLILISRICVLLFLVLAFAKPYHPSSDNGKQISRVLCLYIDNSFSMSADGPEGIALESARQKAYSIVNASLPDTRFALFTNNQQQKQYRFYSREEMIRLIGDVEEHHTVTPLSTILLRINSLINNFLHETGQSVYLISDFQKISTDFQNLVPDTLSSYFFVPVPVNKVPNLYLDSCWFESPAHHVNQVEILNVRVVNNSENTYNRLPVQLFMNDSLKALATVDLLSGEQKTIQMQYTNMEAGLQWGKVSLSDYPVVYDNQFFFISRVDDRLQALLIYGGTQAETKNIEALFAGDAYIRLDRSRYDRLQISRLSDYSALILFELPGISSGLSEELVKYNQQGGTLIVIPRIPADTAAYHLLFQSLNFPSFSNVDTVPIPIADLRFDDRIYRNVFRAESDKIDLPAIHARYRFDREKDTPVQSLLTFADRTGALLYTQPGNGNAYLFSFPFSEERNDFVDHLLFVPTMYNMVLYSSVGQDLFYVLGKDRYSAIRYPSDRMFENPLVRNRESGAEWVPAVQRPDGNFLHLSIDPEMEAGFYSVRSGGDTIGAFALNYDLNESELSYYTSDEIETYAQQTGIRNVEVIREKTGDLENRIRELDSGRQHWKWFIALALFFLFIEFLIIRFWDRLF
ncbi:MAG TPA: BatA domain-containing protein [Prolixibacteraceae bacterium]|nr:BatA domain-containing protein [Prolixibacteraceae bacterium]